MRWNFVQARELVRYSMRQCRKHSRQLARSPLIGMHFRGTDFAAWNEEAILPASFYIDAMDRIGQHGKDCLVRICTDDPLHETVISLRQHYSSRGVLVPEIECSSPFECDFAALAESRYLISSPSTFAIVAGLLGKPAVVHSRKWVENRVAHGEEFWRQIKSATLLGYDVEALV